MSRSYKKIILNIVYTVFILIGSFLASLALQQTFHASAPIPSLFVLATFLVSLVTDGYYYGIAAALISMLAVNFAFTFPYFMFNFTIHENAVSALIMIIVTVITSTLTTKLKHQEMLRMETEKEKMRANLLRAISHDLRTPLTGIYGSSSTILENYEMLADENKMQMLTAIQEDSQWLIRMVENLLTVTKVDDENLHLNKSSVVLEELVDSALAKFKKRYPNQSIVVTLPDDFITISVDAILIEQVLVNLLENAVQHAKGMTTLSLTAYESGNYICIEVLDDGCGVDKEMLKHIFTGSLTSANSSVDNPNQFMGIGLSVCASIVKAHESRIWAENRKEGGMRFGFKLEKEGVSYE